MVSKQAHPIAKAIYFRSFIRYCFFMVNSFLGGSICNRRNKIQNDSFFLAIEGDGNMPIYLRIFTILKCKKGYS